MMTEAAGIMHVVGHALCVMGATYACFAAWVVDRRHRRRRRAKASFGPAVSVLKPLCGEEPHLFENLETFCRQSYANYQLVFGVRSPADRAIAVVERLRIAHPERDIALVVDERTHGSNPKVSNLINMVVHARHDRFVIADSDIFVDPYYLSEVTEPLNDCEVGVVTCLYHARSVAGFWAQMGGQFIDGWFAPSVHVAAALGSSRFGFGATLALRRDTLDAIGGFASLRDRLADDYWLAELARQQGLRTVLSEVMVGTDVVEQHFTHLWQRELRWLRTIRVLNPVGFTFVFVTFSWPLLVAGASLSHTAGSVALAVIGGTARVLTHWRTRQVAGARPPRIRELALAPMRDLLIATQWMAAFTGDHVLWRNDRLPLRDLPQEATNEASLLPTCKSTV
jgi:ceramide glucosyltransferase